MESTPFRLPSYSEYFSLISLKNIDTSSKASKSRFRYLSLPSNIANMVSVAVCPYVMLSEEIEVSMLSIPASIAFMLVAGDIPVVA